MRVVSNILFSAMMAYVFASVAHVTSAAFVDETMTEDADIGARAKYLSVESPKRDLRVLKEDSVDGPSVSEGSYDWDRELQLRPTMVSKPSRRSRRGGTMKTGGMRMRMNGRGLQTADSASVSEDTDDMSEWDRDLQLRPTMVSKPSRRSRRGGGTMKTGGMRMRMNGRGLQTADSVDGPSVSEDSDDMSEWDRDLQLRPTMVSKPSRRSRRGGMMKTGGMRMRMNGRGLQTADSVDEPSLSEDSDDDWDRDLQLQPTMVSKPSRRSRRGGGMKKSGGRGMMMMM